MLFLIKAVSDFVDLLQYIEHFRVSLQGHSAKETKDIIDRAKSKLSITDTVIWTTN